MYGGQSGASCYDMNFHKDLFRNSKVNWGRGFTDTEEQKRRQHGHKHNFISENKIIMIFIICFVLFVNVLLFFLQSRAHSAIGLWSGKFACK
jgi:hypothetical protein